MAEINFGDEVTIDTINANLTEVRVKIQEACILSDRDPREITIVAITKNHSIATVKNAHACGFNIFGENRYQELHEKALATQNIPTIHWHFVGQIQRNKIARIAAEADVIESIDKQEQLDVIATSRHKPQLLLQLSADGDTKRGGVPVDQASALVSYAHQVGPFFTGVMMVPPLGEDPRPHFLAATQFAQGHGLEKISMGMSNDFEIAIECGATHIRLGTALFGERP